MQLVVVAEGLIEPGESAAGQEREDRSGPGHQRIAPRRAMPVQRAAEQGGRRLQHRPSPRRLDELRLGVAALLPGLLGADPALQLLAPPDERGAFGVGLLLGPPALLVGALQFSDARRRRVRVEILHLGDEPRLLDAVGDVEEVARASRLRVSSRAARSRSRAIMTAGSLPEGSDAVCAASADWARA